jgi:hypothetical protein
MAYRAVDTFVVNSADSEGETLSGEDWKDKLREAKELDSFWAIVTHHLLMLSNASRAKPSEA